MVAQDLVHRDEVGHEPLDVVEDLSRREADVEHRAGQRTRRSQQRPLLRRDLLQPPARDVREGQQPQRLARRRAVDHHDVEVVASCWRLTCRRLKSSSRPGDGELLGGDAVDAAVDERAAEQALHGRPVALELLLGRDLLGPQQLAHGVGSAPMSAPSAAERLCAGSGEARPSAGRGGAAARRGGGDRGLADAALPVKRIVLGAIRRGGESTGAPPRRADATVAPALAALPARSTARAETSSVPARAAPQREGVRPPRPALRARPHDAPAAPARVTVTVETFESRSARADAPRARPARRQAERELRRLVQVGVEGAPPSGSSAPREPRRSGPAARTACAGSRASGGSRGRPRVPASTATRRRCRRRELSGELGLARVEERRPASLT